MDEMQGTRTCVWDSCAKSKEGTECHGEICSWCHEVQDPELGTGPGRVTLSRKGRSMPRQGAVDGGHLRDGTENPLGQGHHRKTWVYLNIVWENGVMPKERAGGGRARQSELSENMSSFKHTGNRHTCESLPRYQDGTSYSPHSPVFIILW